ncbi:N-acetylmuramoyl-L-alanine amidase [Bradyrhizobium sp. Arg816]|uniref:N-acetylmuramoyl-L-alanine amidase n=1 Tax=Bradyrhizobium sp. Arg816 TaxID=2998491 RepID=UPI00249DEB12|nr:N-acetylmuramoyl-L-alanine amidase [Bradyrhizobium sp. Arg816]MDI3566608.1 N-acetylmuramoyl-L-alanine amidase [Bradyrhizobium sp. Arg816]
MKIALYPASAKYEPWMGPHRHPTLLSAPQADFDLDARPDDGFPNHHMVTRGQCPFEMRPLTISVVLDVGHTVQAPGARSARNISEYDFNLRLGQRIERRLMVDGFTSTTAGY